MVTLDLNKYVQHKNIDSLQSFLIYFLFLTLLYKDKWINADA